MTTQTPPTLRNWDGSIDYHPHVIIYPRSVEEIVAVMKDPARYPSPVRGVGSNHSTAFCTVAEGGTAVCMEAHFNRVVAIHDDTVTVEAGILMIDVAQALRDHGKQLHINLELGNLSAGVAASGGTKDSSFPDEFGQVNSYCIGMKLVTPAGELLEITEEKDPELMRFARSSYGLFGILYEVTFRVRPVQPMRVEHIAFSLEEFERELPALRARGDSMFMYIMPFSNKVSCEFRSYWDGPAPAANGWRWGLRNFFWEVVSPTVGYLASTYVSYKPLRYLFVDGLNDIQSRLQALIVHADSTSAADQQIRFPPVAGNSKYCFSLWAFPEQKFPEMMRAYFDFCHTYYREHGYRCNMLNVGYRIAQDTSSFFSYSYDGIVMTVDPVATGDDGWQDFLKAYNEFCSERGGRPLFNQTRWLTPAQARKAYGDRLDVFNALRHEHDPHDRMLNDYFAGFFPPSPA